MELISREAAIDAFEKELCGNAREYAVGFNGAKKILENVPSAPRWIPVTERLPKPVAPSQRREWFITSNQYGGVSLTCYEFKSSIFDEGWQTNMTILAWMPLPEPWRGEEDEERLDATEQG